MKKYVKVPVIMQMEALECGAASLSMVMAYHKKWVPLEKVRRDCGVSRDGSSAKNILKAAKLFGMNAKGYRCSTNELSTFNLPCIIHWGFNHFVVFCGFSGKYAYINDPARGNIKIPINEFDKNFTGVALDITPSDDFISDGKPKSTFKFASSRLRGTSLIFVFIILTSFITAVINLIYPVFGRIFLDTLLGSNAHPWFYPFIFIMAAVTVIQAVILYINTIYMLKIEGKLAVVSSSVFIWHVLRLPMDFFSQRLTGDITQRQESNESIASTLIKELGPVLINFLMLILYLVIMIRFNLLLTLVGIISVFLNIFINQYITKKRINITRVRMRDSGKLYSATVAGIEMIETIKSSGAENGYFERWAGYSASVNKADVDFAVINQYWGSIPFIIKSLSDTAILMVGIVLIMQGDITVGMLLAFQGFMISFLTPVYSLMDITKNVQEMRTSIERVDDVLNYEPDIVYNDTASEMNDEQINDNDDETQYAKLTGEIELRNIKFGYSKLSPPLISDFNMKLQPGSRVALIGASGCGKSTIAKLVSGLYKPWEGDILFDGKPISEIPRETFTGSVAVVDQEITLFEDSIQSNIKMWDTTIEDFEMILAARDAQIHEDIMQRDGGYMYKLLEGGRDFSGGQRQRFEISRVLAQDPTIIIMDEATSALDAKIEFEVMAAIKNRGITCIVIAHRLSTIRDCDEIIVLNNGLVVERGTHEELIELGGYYSKLVTTE